MRRSEAFHILNGMYDDATEEQRKALDMAMNDLEFVDLMPDELAPVVHGEWIQVICHEEFEDGFVDRVEECCSVCHAPNWRRTSNYCPNCGAKMDLEE